MTDTTPQTLPDDLTLGAYMAAVYETLLELYRDADLASVATAAMVNELLARRPDAVRAEAA